MINIAIIGTGYVGLVGGVCLAELGNKVACCDTDASKIDKLRRGKVPFYEPGLSKLLNKNIKNRRLSFTLNLERALSGADMVFICVGTPPKENGSADLRVYVSVVKSIAYFLKAQSKPNAQHPNKQNKPFIINKSTVPVGTAGRAYKIIKTIAPKVDFEIVSNPEFLREGSAVQDFLKPERIVLGFSKQISKQSKDRILGLYSQIKSPRVVTNWETAELVKYASNAFLATKISFINEIANVCDAVGADIKKVAKGMGHDSRIGKKFLRAGIGYGGSCFPKDVRALSNIAIKKKYQFKLLKAVIEVNNSQRMLAVKKIKQALNSQFSKKTVCVLGLAFKPETDDTRESASVFIIKQLSKLGINIKAYDPEAMDNAKKELAKVKNIKITNTAYKAIEKSDLVFLATEWNEFLKLDWSRVYKNMKGDIVIDGRNALDKSKIKKAGLRYVGF